MLKYSSAPIPMSLLVCGPEANAIAVEVHTNILAFAAPRPGRLVLDLAGLEVGPPDLAEGDVHADLGELVELREEEAEDRRRAEVHL